MSGQPNADTAKLAGRYGTAVKLAVPPIIPQFATTTCVWLIESPHFSPFSQAILDTGRGYQMLLPGNYCDQFEASDVEMVGLAAWMVWGVVNGHLQMEPNGARDRESWLTSATKTLAHIRGEVHAR